MKEVAVIMDDSLDKEMEMEVQVSQNNHHNQNQPGSLSMGLDALVENGGTETTQTMSSSPSVPAMMMIGERLGNPGTIFKWREDLINERQAEEVDLFLEHQVKFTFKSAALPKDFCFLLATCPTKFLFSHCLQAMYCALPSSPQQNLERAMEILLQLRSVVALYSSDIAEYYDVQGFYYLVDSTFENVLKIHSGCGEKPETTGLRLGRPDINVTVKNWEDLSSAAQSVVLAAQLYFMLMVREEMRKISTIARYILSISQGVPEWNYLFCEVQRRKRTECNTHITKPKKAEMDSLRMALELDPSNLMVWILLLETLFDWMRTEDRCPQFDILGEHFETVSDIATFLHEEIQQALTCNGIPLAIALDLNLLASSFYGYKNLPQIMPIAEAQLKTVRIKPSVNKALTKVSAEEMASSCLDKALRIHPESGRGILTKTFRLLRQLKRDEALQTLKPALEADPLNETIVLVYIRILVGGTRVQLEEAVDACTTALLIANRHRWSASGLVQLFFLKGCLFVVNGDLREAVHYWNEGFRTNKKLFLKQFFYWSKTQIRKYMWPEAFTHFSLLEALKGALEELATSICVETPQDRSIPVAIAAFLREINSNFSFTTDIREEVCRLRAEWHYLLSQHEGDSSSESEPDSDDDGSSSSLSVTVI